MLDRVIRICYLISVDRDRLPIYKPTPKGIKRVKEGGRK